MDETAKQAQRALLQQLYEQGVLTAAQYQAQLAALEASPPAAAPPVNHTTASGERGMAVGRDVSNSILVSGNVTIQQLASSIQQLATSN